MPYELWNLAPQRLPMRSRLYSLVPLGVGTLQVESLTSYVIRLADAHAVSPGVLVRTELFPRLTRCPKRLSCAALHALNGLGAWFLQWVETLENLTARNDLRALTLLPWRGILAGDGILRRHRAWCRLCYQERRERELPVYDFLLWMVASTTACPKHEIPLEEFCPQCQKRSVPFSCRGRPGFCSHCDGWLGSNLPVPLSCEPGNLESHVQTARQIADLLFFGTTQSQPACSNLRDNIQLAIEVFANGNRLLFCRVAGVADRTLTEWLTGSLSPSLPLLLRVARNLGLPLKRLLAGKIAAGDELWMQTEAAVEAERAKVTSRRVAAKRQFEHPVTRSSLWALSSRERIAARAEVKAAMDAALEEDVPRSVRDLFRSLGYRQCVMGRYWFPDLYAAIQLKRKRQCERYHAELERALNEAPPPTVTEVARRLGVNINCVRGACPERYRQLLSRRCERRRFEVAKTAEMLKKAFDEAPASLTRLAARLHRNPDNLRMTYPTLCAEFRQRYLACQSLERQRLDSIYQEHSRKAIDEIIAAGKYPSRKRVLSAITQKNPTLTSISLTSRAVKRIRQETAKDAPAIAGLQLTSVTTIN